MFGKSIKLFKILGFEVKVDLSWLILAFLITWTLAVGWFPHDYPNLAKATYWWMGVTGAIGLFLSIILHELSHSLVARNYGIPMRGITLFIFGGVAEMNEEPPSSKSEFMMAIAGPLASIVIGLICFGIVRIVTTWPTPVHGIISYLAYINLILAAFNLVPAFPLDGGRVLRSILWGWKGNLRWATKISARIGSGFGVFLMILGVITIFTGSLIGGIWWILIGMFLRGASQMSYQQLLMRRSLEGEKVAKFMKTDPITVSSSIHLDELVEDYVYKYHYKMFPVVDKSRLVGCVNTRQLRDIPKEEWAKHNVGELVKGCTEDNSVRPEDDAMQVLSRMKRTGNSRLLVVENSHLVGVVALKDMLNFLSLKVELEDK